MSSNEYMRVYMLKRYHERRKQAIEKLGGKCNICGKTEELEIDHVIANLKGFPISKLWGINKKWFWEEIEKCQLLCKLHHQEKSILEQGHKIAKGTHGTLSAYKYCKPVCDLCRKAKSEYSKQYNKKRRIAGIA
jgi:5-methylcytosine-specific restriction endonuclease McrA